MEASEVIFTHLMLWIAVARHKVKWVKITSLASIYFHDFPEKHMPSAYAKETNPILKNNRTVLANTTGRYAKQKEVSKKTKVSEYTYE